MLNIKLNEEIGGSAQTLHIISFFSSPTAALTNLYRPAQSGGSVKIRSINFNFFCVFGIGCSKVDRSQKVFEPSYRLF